MVYRLLIPYCYVWMSEHSKNRKELFKRYVQGYIKNYHPEVVLVKIEGMTAICERRADYDEWKSAIEETKAFTKRKKSKN